MSQSNSCMLRAKILSSCNTTLMQNIFHPKKKHNSDMHTMICFRGGKYKLKRKPLDTNEFLHVHSVVRFETNQKNMFRWNIPTLKLEEKLHRTTHLRNNRFASENLFYQNFYHVTLVSHYLRFVCPWIYIN